jgi:hypothetical protein
MIRCQSPFDYEPAILSYTPDRMPDDKLRGWMSGKRFITPPVEPIKIEIEQGESGMILEYYNVMIAIMSRRLAKALADAGISNIDFYETEIYDHETRETYHDHLAFNLIGTIAAADLSKSIYEAPDGPVISVDFDSVSIDEKKTRGALMFRLAEAVNGVVVHESIKNAIEAAGIDTLTFFRPEEWVG